MPITAESLQLTLNNEVSSLMDETLSADLRLTIQSLTASVLNKCTDVEEATAEKQALDGFWYSNTLCSGWSPRVVPQEMKQLVGTFRQLAREVDDAYLDTHWTAMFTRGRTGPGRSVGTNGRSIIEKLWDGPLCTTHPYLADLYGRITRQVPDWHIAETARATRYGPIAVVEGNKLSTVPKKRTVRRCTCKEPVLDMFFQLGLGELIKEKSLRPLGISLSKQPSRNRGLALEGSLSGMYSTIDLKSASDRISSKMAAVYFPLLAGLIKTVSSQKTEHEGVVYDLHMLSTMGNGATFPFQTLVFATVVRAAWLDVFNQAAPRCDRKVQVGVIRSWGVFGDDIVVPTELFEKVVWLCDYLGFEVNVDKSFRDGSFRESCGGDYSNGHFVRGVYFKSLLTPQSRYSAANRLIVWCARNAVWLPKTVAHLLHGLPNKYIPLWQDINAGLRMPWAFTAMRPKYQCWVPRVKTAKYPLEGEGAVYLAFLAGHLRANKGPRPEGRYAGKNSPYVCIQWGECRHPQSEDWDEDDDVVYSSRARWCPGELWDGFEQVGEVRLPSSAMARYEKYLLETALRCRR